MTVGELRRQLHETGMDDECEVRLQLEEGVFGILSVSTEGDIVLLDSGDEIFED